MNSRLPAGLILGFSLLVGGIYLEGGSIAVATGISSWLLVLGPLIAFILLAYPVETIRNSFRALKASENTDIRILNNASRLFSNIGKASIIAGLIGAIFQLRHVLVEIDIASTSQNAAGLAVVLMPMVIGLLIKLVFSMPLEVAIEERRHSILEK